MKTISKYLSLYFMAVVCGTKVTRAEKSRKRGYMFGLRHKNRRK